MIKLIPFYGSNPIALKFLMIITFVSLVMISAECQIISKATYLCTTHIAKGKSQDGLNTLYFTDTESVYIHNNYPTENSYVEKGHRVRFIKGDTEGYPIYMNVADRKMIYKSDYHSATYPSFIFEEEIPVIDWYISPDTQKIGSYDCIRAASEYGGRIYDVWFTPIIPTSFGPYKFNGLPGLIVQVASRDEKVKYKLLEYTPQTSDISAINKPVDGQHMTEAEFKEYVINAYHKVRAMSTATVHATNRDPSPDWEIERNKWTIISDYEKSQEKKN